MKDESEKKKAVHYENGRFYFSQNAERKLFFILTLIMLAAGLAAKAGLL